MKCLSSVAPLVLALLLAAAPLGAQATHPASFVSGRQALHLLAHRTPTPPAADTVLREHTVPVDTAERRSRWLYPGVGAVVGAVVGGAWGMHTTTKYDHIGPPPYLVTAPMGAVVGFLAGAVANLVHPR